MKSAYELAMERLKQSAPEVKLTATQKREIAELESRTKARLAERELALEGEIEAADGAGDVEKATKLRQELATDRRKLMAELEEKKNLVRGGK